MRSEVCSCFFVVHFTGLYSFVTNLLQLGKSSNLGGGENQPTVFERGCWWFEAVILRLLVAGLSQIEKKTGSNIH
jgi:hypothetical protein